jgi:RHS repeat-associated protein
MRYLSKYIVAVFLWCVLSSALAGEAAYLARDLGTTASQSVALRLVSPPLDGVGEVAPKSGINFVLYNSSMEVVPENTGVLLVEDRINKIQTLATDRLVMQESGFIEIFANNDAQTPVFFDNMTVTHTPGRVLEVNTYYPYGMLIPELSAKAALPDEQNWYKFSSKELETALNLNMYDFGARLYDPVIDRWISPDPLAEKYYSISPYAYALNNPIRYIDPDGMAVDYAGLYEKDEDENYKYEQQIRAFEAFAMTKSGRQYIIDRAQAGFQLVGVFEKKLNFSVEKAGILDKAGIDVNFTIGTSKELADGTMSASVIDDRLKLNVGLSNVQNDGSKEQIFNLSETIGHEIWYHGDLFEKRFLGLPKTARTMDNIRSSDNINHLVPLKNTKYNSTGIGYLQAIQYLLRYPESKKNTSDYLYYNVIYPKLGFGYPLRPNIKK